jgi:hypothetical protein
MEPHPDLAKDYFWMWSPLSEVVYGAFCGEGGDPPPGRVALRKIVAHRNGRPVLLDLLRCPNPGARAYAAEGLLRLAKKGVALDADTKRAIDWVRTKDVATEICLGCEFLRARAGEHMDGCLEDE